MSSDARHAFEYAILRVMPRVDRGEFLNVGVVLYCQPAEFLAARWLLDPARLRCLDPSLELSGIQAALGAVEAACAGAASAGPLSLEPAGARFRWLTAPRSTVVQPGPVHAGLTDDPGAELDRLLALLVGPVASSPVASSPVASGPVASGPGDPAPGGSAGPAEHDQAAGADIQP